jgi:acetylornithine/succinyldiaminopimelate/putrescine aminotransferase
MAIDIAATLARHQGQARDLHRQHVNPKWMDALGLIGFDREYVRASGCSLWDSDGNRYLDMIGGYAACNVGRNHPVVCKAIADFAASQAASLVCFDAPLLAGLLARQLKGHVGRGLDRVFFTNSGTEGIEAAIKFSRCATGRPVILHEQGSFHGLSTGALAINGCESFRDGFEPLCSHSRAIPRGDLVALEANLAARDVAAFVLEPVQGKGVFTHPHGMIAEAARLCERYGTLLVVDEVQTGVGRTGSFLAIDLEGDVEPHMVVLSKGLSGGQVPVGAVLCRTNIWDRVFSRLDRAVVHSSTFHMNGLAMAAGLATLSVIAEEKLCQRATLAGARLRVGLDAIAAQSPFISDVRQRGLMVGIEFASPESLRHRLAWKFAHALDPNLFVQAVTIPLMRDDRILTQVAGHAIPVLKLTPPLVISDEDIDVFTAALRRVVHSLENLCGPAGSALSTIGWNYAGASLTALRRRLLGEPSTTRARSDTEGSSRR